MTARKQPDWMLVLFIGAVLYVLGHLGRDFVYWDWNWPFSSIGYRVWAVAALFLAFSAEMDAGKK